MGNKNLISMFPEDPSCSHHIAQTTFRKPSIGVVRRTLNAARNSSLGGDVLSSVEGWSQKRPAWSIELDSGPSGTVQLKWSNGRNLIRLCMGLLYGWCSTLLYWAMGVVLWLWRKNPATWCLNNVLTERAQSWVLGSRGPLFDHAWPGGCFCWPRFIVTESYQIFSLRPAPCPHVLLLGGKGASWLYHCLAHANTNSTSDRQTHFEVSISAATSPSCSDTVGYLAVC